jgi:hypothetical protein
VAPVVVDGKDVEYLLGIVGGLIRRVERKPDRGVQLREAINETAEGMRLSIEPAPQAVA